MTKDEALKLALEALELVNIEFVCNGAHLAKKDRHELGEHCPVTKRYQDAIPAIKEALAQQALDRKAENARELGLDYEPENTLHWHALNYRTAPTQNAQAMFEALEKFVASQRKEPRQEPVAWLGFNERGECREVFTPKMKETFPNYPTEGMTPVYTTPPQRKPLSDEEIDRIWGSHTFIQAIDRRQQAFARAIEAAHGIKGEA